MSNFNINAEWEIYYPKVYGYFFRRLNNRLDVEDLTSLVLFQFFQTLADPQKSSRILNQNAYLWKIARNQLATFINNKSKQMIVVGFDDNIDAIDSDLENSTSNEYKLRIEKLLECVKKALSGIDFSIVNYSLIEDRKSPEVASLLNITAENVRKRLSRSVTKLKAQCRAVWKQ